MIETKYGLKYSFPHTIVHINDNSDHTIVPENAVAEDPSLYSTIVVTGAPMGEDNRVVNITNTDILTTAYGMYSLTASDIQKYGQSVEYAQSLVSQGAPVKMLRVTPPGSTYGLSTILVQYKIDEDAKKFLVRFKEANPADYENKYAIYLDRYQNPTRLNRAVCNAYNNHYIEDASDEGWTTRVFMNNISAGRGSDYNNMVTFINKTQQPRRSGDTRYEFGTIDTRSNALVESFIASLINDSSVINRWNVASPVDTVNINVAKRAEGSSIIIPFVNEAAIREVYNEYIKFVDDMKKQAGPPYNTDNYTTSRNNAIFDKLTINTFDVVYGKYIYDTGREDIELDLPMYQVDMYNMDIPKIPDDRHIIAIKGSESAATGLSKDLATYGLENLIPADGNTDWPSWLIENLVIAKAGENNVTGVHGDDIYGNEDPDTHVRPLIRKADSVCLGDIYLVNPKNANPYFSIVAEINQYTGNVTTKSIQRVFKIDEHSDKTNESTAVKTVFVSNEAIKASGAEASVAAGNAVARTHIMELDVGDVFAVTGTDSSNNNLFRLFMVATKSGNDITVYPYDDNLFYYFDYTSYYAGEEGFNGSIYRKSLDSASDKPASYTKLGALCVDDTSKSGDVYYAQTIHHKFVTADNVEILEPDWVKIHTNESGSMQVCTRCHANEVPSTVGVTGDEYVGTEYDVLVYKLGSGEGVPTWLYRVVVTSASGSTFRAKISSVKVPTDYYSDDYGAALYSEAGGTRIHNGSTGFFDGDMNSIEFKWNYSALLTKAFKGQIDPRILSPVRVPAKYLFDAAYNTVCGLTVIPFVDPEVRDVIFASTIFTDEDCEDIQDNPKLIAKLTYEDIDVKQAMYDLMIERNYQRIPEDKRPVGPGSGMSLHLDAGFADINEAKLLNQSFERRFTNPNASWDIGGYTDATNGITYTFTKRLVDNLVRHCKTYTVNKPYVGKYTAIQKSEYTSIFPDVDATDWDLRELLYQSGGNSWVADTNGVVTRRSQRTLMRDSATSDLLQESNMRTLSQLVYLLQNKLDTFLLEYDDDGVLKTMSDECNTMFSGWVGSRVQSLSIRFERDTNIDGRDIVVCYVDVTFRGLVLSIPIIVNVNRRNRS